MKVLYADHSRIEIGIRLQKFSQRLRRDIAASRNRDVRMPRAQLRLQSSGQRGFLNAFVDLKQMRVRFADADPDNFRSAFCGKRSDTSDGQKECSKLNCAEFFAQREINIIRNIIEETEREVHLSRIGPTHAPNVRIKLCKQLAYCVRQIDRNEKALGHQTNYRQMLLW